MLNQEKTVHLLSVEELSFLRRMVIDVLQSSTSAPGEAVAGNFINNLGIAIIRPGGRNCYPALWIRDFIMSLESGVIPADIARDCYMRIASHQAEEKLIFPAGGFVEKGAIPDHISLDNKPIYFPGTYSYEKQGNPAFGRQAPFDDNFYFIEGARLIPALPLAELFPKLVMAYQAVPADEEGLLVQCNESNRGVSFGFTDSIIHTGRLLFASLLKCRAARTLSSIAQQLKKTAEAEYYKKEALSIGEKIPAVFLIKDKMLKSSTEKSSQSDVWGSAFAIYENLIPDEIQGILCRSLTQLLKEGQIGRAGQIRHIPLREGSWTDTFIKYGEYQNGAYWGTPTGWVAYAVNRESPDSARRVAAEYISELQANDYRKGDDFLAPAECLNMDGTRSNSVYLTSVACPYAAFMKMETALKQA